MNAVAVLEVMWDWRGYTTGAGYRRQAPPWFTINPNNFTGGRLYGWLGADWNGTVTNACPDLVSSATQRGKPDPQWLEDNLRELYREAPFELLLVCGKVAQTTFDKTVVRTVLDKSIRLLYTPHPAFRLWSNRDLARCKRYIQEGNNSLRLSYSNGRLRAYRLPA